MGPKQILKRKGSLSMVSNQDSLYLCAINRTIDKMVESISDSLSSFDRSGQIEMLTKIGKLNWFCELLNDIVPEDFTKSDFSNISRHISFLVTFYTRKDFSWFKTNADDLLKKDIPSLKKNLKEYFQHNQAPEPKRGTSEIKNHSLQVITDIDENLRRLIRTNPDNEKEIHDHLEDLLALKGYQFEREQVSIPYSTKKYIPDFTLENQNIAIDVKFCNAPTDERRIIDEINADIPAYQQRYQNVLFVVYDMAVIRRLKDYASSIEKSHQNVNVIIIKH